MVLLRPPRHIVQGLYLAMEFCVLFATTLLHGAEPEAAQLRIRGYGAFGDLQLKRTLQVMEENGHKPAFFEANFVEDSALILLSRLHRDGHLQAHLTAHLTLDDGRQLAFTWDQPVREEPLPRPLKIRQLEFEVHRGKLFYFGSIHLDGLKSLPTKQAEGYFVETTGALHLKSMRIYSPQRLDEGLANLTEALRRLGYESAEAHAEHVSRDDQTGRVDARIAVTEGQKSVVRSIREEFFTQASTQAVRVVTIQTNTPYSRFWLQGFEQQLRGTNFHLGYPDTKIETSASRDRTPAQIQVHITARVYDGPKVWVGQIHFNGEKKAKISVLEERVPLKSGDLLDRVLAEEGRTRLAELGVFDTVGLTYEPVNPQTRNLDYALKEGKSVDVSLLFGWGSYELLRGGVEVDQNDLFGRAHHARLLLTQSFKASYGEYVYTIPELIGHDIDLFFNGSALRREEISFLREEYGGGFGARKFVHPIDSDVTVRYNYQVLNATAPGLPVDTGLPTAGVGAIITEIRHDHVDNVLYPRKGYRLFGNFEVASDYLASDVNYQRIELGGSYHHPLDEGRWIHLGLRHGAIFSAGSAAQDIPFNRRFFPGGQDSIRGYQEGEAAPRNALGQLVGAESYLFGSVELEQALTPAWSLVGFLDTVSFAEHLQDYPFNQTLYSVGLGLSWKTVVGPVRLEYGYNLNPRPHDPMGTLQFSVGFPF